MLAKSIENILEALEKRFCSQHEEEMKLKMELEYSNKTSFFELTFFSKTPRNFSMDFANMFEVSERFA